MIYFGPCELTLTDRTSFDFGSLVF